MAIFQKCGPRADLGWPWLNSGADSSSSRYEYEKNITMPSRIPGKKNRANNGRLIYYERPSGLLHFNIHQNKKAQWKIKKNCRKIPQFIDVNELNSSSSLRRIKRILFVSE
jgi:hypothetical protein